MSITNRNLEPGTHLTGRYRKQTYSCEVLAGVGGKLRYRLADGREFKSPSAAGMAITGHACDGWVFWSIETTVSAPASQIAEQNVPAESPEQHPEQQLDSIVEQVQDRETAAIGIAAQSTPTSFFRTPNQKGAPEGQTRWYCRECGKSFLAPIGQTPTTCPEGHQAG